jgi:hypothetical protein
MTHLVVSTGEIMAAGYFSWTPARNSVGGKSISQMGGKSDRSFHFVAVVSAVHSGGLIAET